VEFYVATVDVYEAVKVAAPGIEPAPHGRSRLPTALAGVRSTSGPVSPAYERELKWDFAWTDPGGCGACEGLGGKRRESRFIPGI